MKTVATYWKPEEAHLLRLRLCDAGIPAFLQDEHSTQLHPWRAAAFGGVRVQVPEADFDAARKLALESAPEAAPEEISGDPDALQCCACRTPIKPDQTRCASCGWSYEDPEERDDSMQS
jgi:hypothetical protein